MSALGQKRTFAVQQVMSALPPKADMCKVHPSRYFAWMRSQIIDKRKNTTPYDGFGIGKITIGCLIGPYRERLIAITPDRHLTCAMGLYLFRLPSIFS